MGSSANCASSMIVINAAMAHQLRSFKQNVDKMIDSGIAKDDAIIKELKRLVKESESIRFEGDGYSKKWQKEAEKRHLTNINSTPQAILKYEDEQSKQVLIGENIFNEKELESRVDVELEKYTKKIQIESRVLGDLTINHIVPTAVIYQSRLLDNLVKLQQIFDAKECEQLSYKRRDLVRDIAMRIDSLKDLVADMTQERKKANNLENIRKKACAYNDKVSPFLDKIREHIDALEMEIDNEIWPLPKYRELLFTK